MKSIGQSMLPSLQALTVATSPANQEALLTAVEPELLRFNQYGHDFDYEAGQDVWGEDLDVISSVLASMVSRSLRHTPCRLVWNLDPEDGYYTLRVGARKDNKEFTAYIATDDLRDSFGGEILRDQLAAHLTVVHQACQKLVEELSV